MNQDELTKLLAVYDYLCTAKSHLLHAEVGAVSSIPFDNAIALVETSVGSIREILASQLGK